MAIDLNGFGKKEKRTWYRKRPMKKSDWITLIIGTVILIGGLAITFWDGSRYYNPFL